MTDRARAAADDAVLWDGFRYVTSGGLQIFSASDRARAGMIFGATPVGRQIFSAPDTAGPIRLGHTTAAE